MFEERIKKNLKEDEEIIQIVRIYPLIFIIPFTISALLVIAPFFFLFYLFNKLGWIGVIIFFCSLLFGILIALRQIIIYSLNVFVITNQRIIDIDQKGFFDKTVSESTFDKIQDVSYRIKGLFQTVFHYGDIIIQTAGTKANLELSGIKNPQKVQELIAKLVHEISENKKGNNNLSATELVEMIKKIKENIKDRELDKILKEKNND